MKQESSQVGGGHDEAAHKGQIPNAPAAPIAGEGQTSTVDHFFGALPGNLTGEVGQRRTDHQLKVADLSPICDTLREMHRQMEDLHRAEKSMTLRIRAKCFRLCDGDKKEAEKVYKSMLNGCKHELAIFALSTATPFISARSVLEQERKHTKKQMAKLAKDLPVYPWVESVRGFGAPGFAMIIGEAGDLSNYSTHSKLWKRLGLAVINGDRQRRVSGADAIVHGYCPSRRAVVWSIGDSMIKAGGEYADLFRARKEYEREKAAAEGLTVCPQGKIPAKNSEQYRSDGHIRSRAQRYMEKRLVRDLWREWRNV
jgi:hypothetical protein